MNKDFYKAAPVLIVDDEKNFLTSVETQLISNGLTNVECLQDSNAVLPNLAKKKYAVVLLDLKMPPPGGKELLIKIVEEYPEIPVIIITGCGDERTAVECMKIGAFYYLTKPFKEVDVLIKTIKDALDFQGVFKDVKMMRRDIFSGSLNDLTPFSDIITHCEKMMDIFQKVSLIAVTSNPVLINGETGVGKELIARAIHKCSHRKGNPITVNIAGEDDLLFSDTLFGHIKGAFTDAYRDRKGLIEQAEDGSIFLDEIGDLSPTSQIKLLRLIQEKEYYPLGSDEPHYSNARIIAATNKDLKLLQETGKFRQDLFYRLATHMIFVPPLRERKNDIPALLEYFLARESAELNKKKPTVPKELYQLLGNYDFPGNIRELENMVKDAISQHISGILSMDVFLEKIKPPQSLSTSHGVVPPTERKIVFGETMPTIEEVEEAYIEEVMKRVNDNQTMAARLADMDRRAFAYRVKKFEEKKRGK